MKAIRVHQTGEPEVMRLEEIPTPAPGTGQVLVRIKAAGVNPVETYIRSGKYPVTPPLPYTPGSDAAGIVERVGADVTRVKAGDRIYTAGSLSGTYAEFALCQESQLHPLPDTISFEQGAAVNIPCATAYRALFIRAKAVPGESVLIHGASGGVGIAAVQIARSRGLRVIGTAGTDAGRKLVMEQGAHDVLDHRDPEHLEKLMTLTSGRGVDVILEMLANVNLAKDLTALAKFGRVVVIGSRGPVEINPRDAMARDATVMGMLLFNADEKELAGIHTALGASLANGTLRPVIGKTFSLADAPQAHHAVMTPGALGKIVLVP
jgi:NADPH2:quinone reductase